MDLLSSLRKMSPESMDQEYSVSLLQGLSAALVFTSALKLFCPERLEWNGSSQIPIRTSSSVQCRLVCITDLWSLFLSGWVLIFLERLGVFLCGLFKRGADDRRPSRELSLGKICKTCRLFVPGWIPRTVSSSKHLNLKKESTQNLSVPPNWPKSWSSTGICYWFSVHVPKIFTEKTEGFSFNYEINSFIWFSMFLMIYVI